MARAAIKKMNIAFLQPWLPTMKVGAGNVRVVHCSELSEVRGLGYYFRGIIGLSIFFCMIGGLFSLAIFINCTDHYSY